MQANEEVMMYLKAKPNATKASISEGTPVLVSVPKL